MKSHLFIRNAAGVTQIDLVGDIGDEGLSIPAVTQAISETKRRTSKLLVTINSPGGNAWAGDHIYTALRQSGMHVTTRCDGYALSAASLILMAGDVRQAVKNAVMMIHDPHSITVGNIEEHESTINAMDAIGNRYAGIYAQTTGMSQEKCRALMKAETWFTADEALQMGFVTHVLQENRMAASFDLGKYQYMRIAACAQAKHGTSAAKRWELAKAEGKAAVSEFEQRRNPAAVHNWIGKKYPGLREEFIEEFNAAARATR